MYVVPAKKKHGFSSVFAKRTSKNIEFFPDFRQKDAGSPSQQKSRQGNRAWDPCFVTTAPRRLHLVERHQIAARYVGHPPPPPKTLRNRRRAGGGLGGGGVILYPLVRIRHAEQCRRMCIYIYNNRQGSMELYIPLTQIIYTRGCQLFPWLWVKSEVYAANFASTSLSPGRRPQGKAQKFKWVWVKIKPPGDHRFWSMCPLARVPFGVPIFDPQPNGNQKKPNVDLILINLSLFIGGVPGFSGES